LTHDAGARLRHRDGAGATRQPIPVLLYHTISDAPSSGIAPFAVSLRAFERHLDLIEEAGGETLTVSDLVDRLSGGERLPRRAVVITFDDGFADTLDVAAPSLWRRRMVATVYVATGYLTDRTSTRRPAGQDRMLTWDRVGELEGYGLELGAHTHTHPQLDVLPHTAATVELRISRILLETSLGHRVRSFAYPHGYASGWLRQGVQRAGFDSACGVRNALSHARDDRWCIARLTVRAGTDVQRVAAWLRGHGAPIAPERERLQTRAWRGLRRARYVVSFGAGYGGPA
jgi:peptidoglycan/xylan/chitin deacetylase (PgdA/CDA1 family)